MKDISPQLQNQITQFQQVQQQLQSVSAQKYQMEAQMKEMERTLEELVAAAADSDVYRSVGSLLIKVQDKEKVKNDLDESKETLEIRVKALDRQEKTLREKFQNLQETLNKALGSGQGN